MAIAEQLEGAILLENAPSVDHFVSQWETIEKTVVNWGLAIPSVMGGKINGVSGVAARTLIPGDKSLVSIMIGPGGGKRYRCKKVLEEGISRLVSHDDGRIGSSQKILALAQSPDWRIAWIEYKDDQPTAYVLADAGGIHKFSPVWGEQVSTTAWAGLPPKTPALQALKAVFGL